MPPKIADAIRILAAETLEGCSNDWSDSAKADEVLRAVYDLIFEAGVQAERERIEEAIEAAREVKSSYTAPIWQRVWRDGVDTALAAVTAKEGASDEG